MLFEELNILSAQSPTTKSLIVTAGILAGTILILHLFKIFGARLKALNPEHKDFEDIIPFLENIIKIVVVALGVGLILKTWKIDVTPLLASAGVAGIAAAFAAQEAISNLFGGISIFLDKPFKVGDFIVINEIHRGQVYEIGARSTKIKTLDNILVTIPNSIMVKDPIFNETGYDSQIVLRIPVGVAYGSDLDKVERILTNCVNTQEGVVKNDRLAVRFIEFGEYSIDLEVVATIAGPERKIQMTHELIKSVYDTLNSHGVQIPFPQREVKLLDN